MIFWRKLVTMVNFNALYLQMSSCIIDFCSNFQCGFDILHSLFVYSSVGTPIYLDFFIVSVDTI